MSQQIDSNRCINCKACHYDIHEPAWWESDSRTYDYYYCYDPEWSDKAEIIDDPYNHCCEFFDPIEELDEDKQSS